MVPVVFNNGNPAVSSSSPPIQRITANQAPPLIVRPAALQRARSAGAQRREREPHPKDTHQAREMDSTRRRQTVCRSLFGPVDHDQLRRDLKLRVMEIVDQDRRRWNFDFQTETPLPGRFQWEEVATTSAAALHRVSTPPRDACASNCEGGERRTEAKGDPGADQENCSSISNTRKCPSDGTPARGKRTLSKSAGKLGEYARITGEQQQESASFKVRLFQTAISEKRINKSTFLMFVFFVLFFFFADFFPKRRRNSETKVPLHPLHSSSAETSMCKTLR